jgi:hypothetical protein
MPRIESFQNIGINGHDLSDAKHALKQLKILHWMLLLTANHDLAVA